MQLKANSKFDTNHRTGRIIGSQIRDHCREWSSWGHKSVDDIVFGEVNNIDSFNFSGRCNFRPFREVMDIARMNWWPLADGGLISPMTSIPQASNSHEATVGWSNSGGWCLTSLTLSCILYCISNHCRTIIAKSVQSILKLRTQLMGTAYAIMSFFDYFLRFRVGETMKKYTVIWTAVKCLYYWIIVKMTEAASLESSGNMPWYRV